MSDGPKVHSEKHLRHRDQLDVARPVLAQDSDVVVHPQPPILDVERESPADDRQVNLHSDTLIIASASARDRELGKERKFSINSDGDGLMDGVDHDEDLPKFAVSILAQNHWHVSRITMMVRGPRPRDTSKVFVVLGEAYTSPCSTAKTWISSPFTTLS